MRQPRLASLFPALPLLLLASAPATAGDTLRVPSGGYATIQAAIDDAQSGDTILVESGTYRGAGNRDIVLGSKELTIRGEKGAALCRIECEGTLQVPFRGIVIDGGQTSATVIEGLTISGGATLPGAVADPFNGGAIQMLGTSPVIRDCVFVNNVAGCWGGAVYSGHGGTPLIENCVFEDNWSGDGGGGFFSWDGSAPTVRNSVFRGNDGTTTGGGLLHFSVGAIQIESCTFTQNKATWGTGLSVWGANITNTLVWGNEGDTQVTGGNTRISASFCDFEGGLPDPSWDAGGNIEANPLFENDGLHLRLASPCRNAGDPNGSYAGQKDMDGQARVAHGRIDIGADEGQMRSSLAR